MNSLIIRRLDNLTVEFVLEGEIIFVINDDNYLSPQTVSELKRTLNQKLKK